MWQSDSVENYCTELLPMGVDMRMMDSRILGPMGRNGADSRDVVLKVNYFIGLERD